MSGIYISGMEMPKACVFCELYESDMFWCSASREEIDCDKYESVASFCPLVPVPPRGDKPFEVRYNDRGYQKGDTVEFHVIDRRNVVEPLDGVIFEITYVLSGWHIEPDYVVFGIRRMEETQCES